MNLVFIYTDEQRPDTMAAYGNDQIETPNLNRLAADSSVFDRAYCTQPTCTPARSSILTGLFPHATGCTTNNAPLKPDVRCLPEYLPAGKYATCHVGKWHLGDELFAQHGFEEWIGTEDGYHPYYSEGRDRDTASEYKKFLIQNGFPPDTTRSFVAAMSEQFTKAHFVGQQAAAFIERNKAQPFVLYAGFLEPHMPFFGPRNDQYDPADIPLPDNFDAPPGPEQHLKYRLYQAAWKRYHYGRLQNIKSEIDKAVPVEFPLETDAHWQRLIANYWGLVSMVDTAVGHILDAIEAAGLEDDTVVVFTSDHGDMMGSHQLLTKMVQYEEAARVPLLVKVPGRRNAGMQRIVQPVSQVDLVPTLLDLLGETVPEEVHGQSLAATVRDGTPPAEDHVFIEWNGKDSGFGNYDPQAEGVMPDRLLPEVDGATEWAAVRDPIRTVISPDGWKLNVSHGGFGTELYHLASDPGERHNRLRDPAAREIVERLLSRLAAWQERVGDTVPLPTTYEACLAT